MQMIRLGGEGRPRRKATPYIGGLGAALSPEAEDNYDNA